MGFNEKLLAGASAAAPVVPSDNFAPVLFNGNNTTVTTGFQTDLAFIANRQHANGNFFIDSVRGVKQTMFPSTSDQEGTRESVTAFGSTSITIGTYSSIGSGGSGNNILWAWKAGGAPSATNSAGAGNAPTSGSVMIDGAASSAALAGSIAATKISANTAAGFSIVTYSGASTTSTVAHGLTSAPELIIVKGRTVTAGWPTLYNDGSNSYTVRLSETGANDNANKNLMFGNGSSHTAPTSSVFTVGNSDETNQGHNYVAYCFHSVPNYSKIGSFDATGSEQFIDIGFTPRWLMIKKVTSSGSWPISDSVRSPGTAPYCIYNNLYANTQDAEGVSASNCNASYVQYTSTGFGWQASQISAGTNPNYWESGQTFIYIAYA